MQRPYPNDIYVVTQTKGIKQLHQKENCKKSKTYIFSKILNISFIVRVVPPSDWEKIKKKKEVTI